MAGVLSIWSRSLQAQGGKSARQESEQAAGGVSQEELACVNGVSPDPVLGSDEAGVVVAAVGVGVVAAIAAVGAGGEVDFAFCMCATCRVIAYRRTAARSAHALLP